MSEIDVEGRGWADINDVASTVVEQSEQLYNDYRTVHLPISIESYS